MGFYLCIEKVFRKSLKKNPPVRATEPHPGIWVGPVAAFPAQRLRRLDVGLRRTMEKHTQCRDSGGGGLIRSIVTPAYSVMIVVLCGDAKASKMVTVHGWQNFRNASACASLAAQRCIAQSVPVTWKQGPPKKVTGTQANTKRISKQTYKTNKQPKKQQNKLRRHRLQIDLMFNQEVPENAVNHWNTIIAFTSHFTSLVAHTFRIGLSANV